MTTTEKRPRFGVDSLDLALIEFIVERAQAMEKKHNGRAGDKLTWIMDLCACHNSCPLQLARLYDADDANFSHDVFGIKRHMNRDTGELGGCFLPRFAERDKATA